MILISSEIYIWSPYDVRLFYKEPDSLIRLLEFRLPLWNLLWITCPEVDEDDTCPSNTFKIPENVFTMLGHVAREFNWTSDRMYMELKHYPNLDLIKRIVNLQKSFGIHAKHDQFSRAKLTGSSAQGQAYSNPNDRKVVWMSDYKMV